jgi:hypothetical protein
MTFSASPLNPASLGWLIAHLRATAPGRFTVESCSLVMEEQGANQVKNGLATCHLNWWTLTPNAD